MKVSSDVVTNVSFLKVQGIAIHESYGLTCNCRNIVCQIMVWVFFFILEAVLCHYSIVVQDYQYQAIVETQVMALKLHAEVTSINHSLLC